MPEISVIIPAFNAESTLSDTLGSVRAQTLGAIDIIVVNDGSSDGTEEIARRHAKQDRRIRIITTPNRGVAAARNAGIHAAASQLIAPIDADDLWHPQRLERQLVVMREGGTRMGFVYSPFRRIAPDNTASSTFSSIVCQGRVFLRSVFTNFVGNGSCMLVRRQAVDEVGGYSTELREHGVEGAEDWLLQTLIARHWQVGAVHSALVGYRARAGAMSANPTKMLHSQLSVLNIVARQHPEVPDWVLAAARARLEVNLATKLAAAHPGVSAKLVASAIRRSPETAAEALRRRFVRSTRRVLDWSNKVNSEVPPPAISLRHFHELGPDEGASGEEIAFARTMRRIADAEIAFCRD